MEKIQTVEIQYLDPLETYTAHIQKNGSAWIGWVPEVPEVKCEESSRQRLLKTLEDELHAVLEAEWEKWCKQFEEDVNAGKLDNLSEKALEDLQAGRCEDL
jgi:hypothetical protein